MFTEMTISGWMQSEKSWNIAGMDYGWMEPGWEAGGEQRVEMRLGMMVFE